MHSLSHGLRYLRGRQTFLERIRCKDDFQGKLGNMLENRTGHYEGRADITVSTDDKNPASVAREIYSSVISR